MRSHSGLRHLLAVLFGLALLLGSPLTSAAQTPVATPAPAGSGPVVGDGVVLFGPSGRQVAQIAVLQVVAPYVDAAPADRGYHWVGVEILVQNLGANDFRLNAYDVRLIDSIGINNVPADPVREAAEIAARPALPSDPVASGGTGGGWLFYEVIDGATPAQIVYSSFYAYQFQFLLLANLAGEIATMGDATALYAPDGSPTGSITVDEIFPDFAEIDSGLEVPRGMTGLALEVTVTNETSADLDPQTSTIELVDELGHLHTPAPVLRGVASTADYPDFFPGPIPAGESRSGILIYELPPGASPSYVISRRGPAFESLFIVAQPGESATLSGERFTPEDGVAATGSGECAGVENWVTATNLAFLPLVDTFDVLDGGITAAEADQLRDAANQVSAVRDLHGFLVTPEIAREAHQAFLDMLDVWEASFGEMAERLEAGEDPAAIEADIADPEGEFLASITAVEDAVANLESTCPDSNIADLGF